MSRINDPSEQASQTADQLKDKAAKVSENIRDVGGQVREAATQKYGEVKDQATQYYNQGRDAAEQWEQNLETYVQDKPLQAVMIAAGVGLLLGLLWKRS